MFSAIANTVTGSAGSRTGQGAVGLAYLEEHYRRSRVIVRLMIRGRHPVMAGTKGTSVANRKHTVWDSIRCAAALAPCRVQGTTKTPGDVAGGDPRSQKPRIPPGNAKVRPQP